MTTISAALALCFASGCASSYVPRPGPRVSLVMDGGNYAYVRDGKKYEGGLFGGDIVEAVRGNPQAEDYARAYKRGLTTGLIMTFLGAAVAVAGILVVSSDVGQRPTGQSIPPTGFIVAGGGLLVELIGGIIELNAMPHLHDAINVYNDGLDAPPSVAPRAGTLR